MITRVPSSVVIPPDARRLNAHVVSLLRSCRGPAAFRMPVEVDGRVVEGATDSDCGADSASPLSGRLSSFGFSGTITHGLFEDC